MADLSGKIPQKNSEISTSPSGQVSKKSTCPEPIFTGHGQADGCLRYSLFRVYPLMGEFVKVRGLPTHGGIHQGNGQFVKVRGLPAHGDSSRYGAYLLMGEFIKVRGIPAHGRIR